MKYDLVGIGNALVDLEVAVDDDFIHKLSLTKGGMALSSSEDQNKILDSLSGLSTKIVSGGSAANTIHGVSVLGGKTYYLGKVADDGYGKHYTIDMKFCGVGFPGPDAQSVGTGTCVVMVTPDSERTMVTHLGISSSLHSNNVDESIVTNSKAVYIEGYLWTGDETRAAAMKMAEIAKKNGIPIAFTLSDAFVANSFREEIIDFIRWNVDTLFCNNVEAKALAGTETDEEAFTILLGMADTVFLTRGKQGAWAANSQKVKVSIDAFTVQAVDTTGAGDLFAAGTLYGLIKNYSLKESAIIGSYCAAEVVTHMGGRMPTTAHTDIKTILASYQGS